MSETTSTPASVWAEMRAGNERFVEGTPLHPRQDVERRHELAGMQRPIAALFGCSDSRLAAEIIFDMGLGDLFVVRNAGQVMAESIAGSLEYAVEVLGVKLIVVLAHDACGAVAAAVDSVQEGAPVLPGHIRGLVQKITPAIYKLASPRDDKGALVVADLDPQEVGRMHLRDTVHELLQSSDIVARAVADGRLAVVGANYRLAEGRAYADTVIGEV